MSADNTSDEFSATPLPRLVHWSAAPLIVLPALTIAALGELYVRTLPDYGRLLLAGHTVDNVHTTRHAALILFGSALAWCLVLAVRHRLRFPGSYSLEYDEDDDEDAIVIDDDPEEKVLTAFIVYFLSGIAAVAAAAFVFATHAPTINQDGFSTKEAHRLVSTDELITLPTATESQALYAFEAIHDLQVGECHVRNDLVYATVSSGKSSSNDSINLPVEVCRHEQSVTLQRQGSGDS